MDPDVVEIPPPIHPTMFKHKEVKLQDVIEIDDDGDSVGLMFFNEAVDSKNKGKSKMFASDGYNDLLDEEASVNLFGLSNVGGIGMNGVESSKSYIPGTPNVINLDDHSTDVSCDDDEDDDDDDYIDLVSDDFMDVDEYAMLQAHFDSSNIPPGVEATIPVLLDPRQSKKKPIPGTNPSFASSLMNTTHFSSTSTSSSSSNFPVSMDYANQPTVVNNSPPSSSSQSIQSKKKVANSQHKGASASPPLGVLSKFRGRRQFQGRKKQLNLSSSTNYDSVGHSTALKLPTVLDPSFWEPYIPDSVKQFGANSFQSSSSFTPLGALSNPHIAANHSPGVGPSLPWSQPGFKSNYLKPHMFGLTAHSSLDPWSPVNYPQETAEVHWLENFHHTLKNEPALASVNSAQAIPVMDKGEVLRKFVNFKQFDTVDDHSDHQYTGNGSSFRPSSKSWAKRIQEEWKILEKDLPDTIFVRVYETRMDILRAAIVGADGTPYHDGLFFFDVFFPNNYPNVPPHVYYHSGGLRLNPNLYNTGKVCLSLLNTWSGSKNEKWIPGTSTMLQVLVSIQGLILNAKPYFNEPGYAHLDGSVNGEKRSLQYNENTFILSLKTMTYSIRRPPKHFEDLVMGHFLLRGHDILVACKAYMDGAQVGCVVKGGANLDEGDKSCSKPFKDSLVSFIQLLVDEFSRIGVEGCEKFVLPTVNVNGQVGTKSRNAPGMLPISN